MGNAANNLETTFVIGFHLEQKMLRMIRLAFPVDKAVMRVAKQHQVADVVLKALGTERISARASHPNNVGDVGEV
jgi:hypothetical protein